MKVLIIEDEKPAAQRLERLLKEIEPGIEISARLESVEETINWWMHNPHPDLLLMDIQLEDGVCFEIFESAAINTPVIFVTAFDEYALRAFKVNSIDYLLKPVDREALAVALNKYKTIFYSGEYNRKLGNLISDIHTGFKERFLIKIGEHFRSVQTRQIRCFFIRERYTFILTDQGKEYPLDYSLEKIERFLDPMHFFRINRNFIINYAAINDVISYSTSRLKVIISGWNEPEDLIVSRDRVSEFKDWMDR
ncbi:MAG TPA: LytTR family DNA-binding domain-containing protein [Bacteroidales bacterium]|jgi:DNA-binding LytR/AlgR family response regulator|nr:LytTR family DNA-binding domain-containing protein [Bacteroidales bacterium]